MARSTVASSCCPISRPYLPYISPISPLYLPAAPWRARAARRGPPTSSGRAPRRQRCSAHTTPRPPPLRATRACAGCGARTAAGGGRYARDMGEIWARYRRDGRQLEVGDGAASPFSPQYLPTSPLYLHGIAPKSPLYLAYTGGRWGRLPSSHSLFARRAPGGEISRERRRISRERSRSARRALR